MKKGQEVIGIVTKVEFPNKGFVSVEGEDIPIVVKNVIPGQKVRVRISKKRSYNYEGIVLEIVEKAFNEINSECPHSNVCGGCSYQTLGYDDQLILKSNQLTTILKKAVNDNMKKILNFEDDYFDKVYEGIKASPVCKEYRNKMEFSFGDSCKGGELELGLHKKSSFYDIVTVANCQLVDSDFRKILVETLSYFKSKDCNYFHKLSHEGFLRHLLIRKASKTGEIMVCLVSSSQIAKDTICCEYGLIEDWKKLLLSLNYKGKICGIMHVINDSLSDVVQSDETRILYGRDYINEEILGLKFKITPFSFFQTNSLSAELIYSIVCDMVCDEKKISDSTVFDLYSGTGTIAQLIAKVAKKVIGIEIVQEAVVAAMENAKLNGLNNCNFLAGDVLKTIDEISDKPDFIILDPPRDGVHPKALKKIIEYGVSNIVYISCKPTSLARDMETLIGCGYIPKRIVAIDQFPSTSHVETCVLLCHQNASKSITIDYTPDGTYMDSVNKHASYREINEYIEEKYGYKVHSAYIAQVKRECGIEMGENYNLSKSEDYEPKQVTEEKREAIIDALKHFKMI